MQALWSSKTLAALGIQAFLFHDPGYTFTAITKSSSSQLLLDAKRALALVVVNKDVSVASSDSFSSCARGPGLHRSCSRWQ
jgi:hypothetical protein